MEKKFGLLLRAPQQKKQPTRPPLPRPTGFAVDDDDDVEKEISRHAAKNKSLKDIEQQHQKALEEDPSIFDYDGVYDEMKEKAVLPKAQDRQERKPRYIQKLMEKAKIREREHEIVYERKLAKERSVDDHLFADKDKFLTSAYKKKLAEQAKWLQEERMREMLEEKDDVTKKSDITDFYFNLKNNVAFGAREEELRKEELKKAELKKAELKRTEKEKSPDKLLSDAGPSSSDPKEVLTPLAEEKRDIEAPAAIAPRPENPVKPPEEEAAQEKLKAERHKRNQDALAAAKERFLARKKAKEQ